MEVYEKVRLMKQAINEKCRDRNIEAMMNERAQT